MDRDPRPQRWINPRKESKTRSMTAPASRKPTFRSNRRHASLARKRVGRKSPQISSCRAPMDARYLARDRAETLERSGILGVPQTPASPRENGLAKQTHYST